MERPHPRFLPCLLVALLAGAAYSRTLGFGFVFDDRHLIVDNAFLREASSLVRAFAHHFWYGTSAGTGYYRPLVVLSLCLNGRILGWGPFGFHLLNVVLHAANAVLVLILGRRLGFGDRSAALGAVLFALHPAASWAVASIVARVDLLAAFFVLLAWTACAPIDPADPQGSPRPWRRAALCGAFFLGALLCKESAVAFLVVPLLASGGAARRVGALACALAALCLYGALRVAAGVGLLIGLERVDPSTNPLAHLGPPARMVAALALSGRYLLYLLWPFRGFGDPLGYSGQPALPQAAYASAVLSLALVLAWAAAAWALWRRREPAAAPLAFSLASFLPASNLLTPIASLYALNFLYMPLLGLALAAASIARRMGLDREDARSSPGAAAPPRAAAWTTRTVVPLAAALAVALAGLSMREASIWRDDVGLFTSWTRRFPMYTTAWSHLGAALMERGDIQGAVPALRKAVALDGANAEAHYDLGAALARSAMLGSGTDILVEALDETRAALRLSPGLAPARVNESKILLMQGKPAEAEGAARAALAIKPGYPPALENLGAALYKQSRFAAAAGAFREQSRLAPEDRNARSHYIVSLLEGADLAQARRESLAARVAFPEDSWFDFCLARVEARSGDRLAALALLRSIVPGNPRARAWLAETSDFDALRSDPAFRRLIER